MVPREKKEKRIYQFEIGRLGLVIVGVATFGVLLWMFIFGIWVGRDTFSLSKTTLDSRTPVGSAPNVEKGISLPGITIRQNQSIPGDQKLENQPAPTDGTVKEQTEGAGTSVEEAKPAHKVLYTLQVASLRDVDKTAEMKAIWEKKGYEVFVVSTEIPQKGTWYRVQIGRFASADEAGLAANKIAQTEKTRLFITTISVPVGP